MTHTQSPTTPAIADTQVIQRLPLWRLLLPLVFQTGIILAAPAQPFYTQLTGKTVILRTLPVDPYDPLRGYSQTLSYDVSRVENLRLLPGWQDLAPSGGKSSTLPAGTKFYTILEAPAVHTANPPQAWKPISVSRDRPLNLPPNQIALQGKSTGNSIEYGLETYYMPEQQRNAINQGITQAQNPRQRQAVVVEVKVDTQGRAVPISFWISNRNYRF